MGGQGYSEKDMNWRFLCDCRLGVSSQCDTTMEKTNVILQCIEIFLAEFDF